MSNQPQKRAAIYVRGRNTEGQRGRCLMAAQLASATDFVLFNDQGHDEDLGLPLLEDLLTKLEDFDMVVVASITRLSHSAERVDELKKLLAAAGVELIVVGGENVGE